MKVKDVTGNLRLALSMSEMNRVEIYQTDEGLNITADVHGMNHRTAQKFIYRIMNIVTGPFHLCIVHGYNNGTVLKEMFRKEFGCRRIESKFGVSYNKGVTHFLVKPMFGLY